jgi:hypothetical protein
MPEQKSRAEWVENRRQYVLQTAKQAADGTVNLLLAVYEIHKWLYALPELTRQVAKEDIGYLKKVCDESRELPLSTERQYWAPESLREKDLIAQSLIRRVREEVLSVFARVVDDLRRGT